MSLKRSSVARAARLSPVALALLVGGLQAARAEDLVQLYDAARAYDAAYLSARAQAESVEYAAAQSKAGLLPQVSAAVTANRTGAFHTGLPGDPIGGNETTARLNGRQPLYAPAAAVTIKQAYKRLDEARIALDAAEQSLIVRVAQAYFDVLGAQDTLTTAGANKTAIGEQLASAKRNFEVGTATITDTREAQARYDLALANEIVAENDLRTKRVALDQLVGRNNVVPNKLPPATVLPPVEPADPQQWVQSAGASNPNVRRAQLESEVAQLETDKARTGHLPTVDAVASAGTDHNWGTISDFSRSSGTSKTATVGLQLNVPLFAGFAVQNRVKETLSLQDKAREDLAAAKRDAEQSTRTAYLGVQSGIAQVKALEAAQASSKLALEATQLGYKVGVRVNLDVLNAQNQLYSTERDLAKARYDVLVGELRLRQAAGTLKPQDLAAINALLAR